MAMALVDEVRAVRFLRMRAVGQRARIRAEAHRAALLLDALLRFHQRDDRMRRLRIELRRMCISHAADVAGKLDDRALHAEAEAEEWDFMLAGIFDGLVVVGSIDQRPLCQIYAQNDNLVFVHNLHHHDPDYDAVWSDLEQATEQCLDELVALGHRSIGYIGGPNSIQNIFTRESQECRDVRDLTFECKMKELGLFNPDQVWLGNWSAAEGQRLAAAAIAQGALPSAFLIGSDPMSMGALRAFREAGISVPEDLSIISFDDIEAAAYMSPPLSTVRLHTEEIGRQAIKTLYDRLLGREVVVNVVIPCQLVRRQSHARAKTR